MRRMRRAMTRMEAGNAGSTSSYRCGSTLMLEHLMTEKFTIHHLRYFLRKFLHIRCLIHEYNISI